MIDYSEMIQITYAKSLLTDIQSAELASSFYWIIDDSIQGGMIPALELIVVLAVIICVFAIHGFATYKGWLRRMLMQNILMTRKVKPTFRLYLSQLTTTVGK